ncbi:MAG TPA: serine hydrolase domain-containing protein [Candidatus Limnocylindria bacterium]|nr:serine hydrolase domain-containing protein [Candidatus Limnocylindria bacterium]
MFEQTVRDLAEELGVPGVAVGMVQADEEQYAYHGVTNIENPLPVDAATLFQFGSTGKTFTSVAILRLVEAGRVDLDAPVRTYVPELRLADEHVADTITVLQLLNHTAGWEGDDFTDTGEGDDAIARYVANMAQLRQVTPPGFVVSYNNASLSLAGRVIEKATGTVYERALKELVLDPVGLHDTLFFPNDVMTRRFVVGHRREEDGSIKVLRPWAMARSGNPMGGLSATAPDQIRWARFHLDGGRTRDGTQLVSNELICRMQEPTVHSPGSDLGDAVGISWLLSEIDGTKIVAHGGSTNGQYAGFTMVPSHRFAIVSLTNAEPNGPLFNRRIRDWALERYLGLVETDPVPAPRDADALRAYAGRYASSSVYIDVDVAGDHLAATILPTAELIAQLGEDADYVEPPVPLRMLPETDRYIVTEGSHDRERGFFVRDPDTDAIAGIHMHGRFVPRSLSR